MAKKKRLVMRSVDEAQLLKERPYLAQILANPPLPGTLAIAHVYHDDWCAIWKGKACNCDCKVTLEYPNLRMR